ncbi:hypothetical protein O3P69_013576 [Scylla paramamosain]|uniref:PDZ and LIM domain protein Zasp n=1 Tax=Scylla paramamosain TaxID=85552 RepID=A0AAW0SPN2_SCYPA
MSISTVKLSRTDGTPWGFRLQGGKDFATPLCVQKVNAGSLAAVAGLQAGDAIVSIGGRDALALRHKEAQEAIVRAGNNFDLVIQRGSQVWRPQVTPLAQVKTTPEGVPVATNTSLAANKKHVAPVGVKHNVKARPFAEVNGQQIVNAQYNTPLQLYSEDNIAETLSAQAEVLGKGCLGVNFMKNERAYDGKTSDVLRMVQEMDSNPVKEPEDSPAGSAGPATGFRSVRAPETKVRAPGEPSPSQATKCSECERPITGVFVRVKNKSLHADCFKCATCGSSLKNVGYYNINEKLYCDVHAKQAARHHPPAPNMDPIIVKPGAPTPSGALPASAVKAAAPYKPPAGGIRMMPSAPAPAPAPMPKFTPIAPPKPYKRPVGGMRMMPSVPAPAPAPMPKFTPIARPKPEPVVAAPELPPPPAPEPVLPPQPVEVEAPEPEPVPAEPEPVVAPPTPPPVMTPPPAVPAEAEAEAPAPAPEPEVEIAPAPIEVLQEPIFQPEPEPEPEPAPEPAPIPAPAPAPIQVPAAPMAAPPPTFSPVKAPAAPAPQPAPFGAPAGGVDVRSHIPKKGTVMAAATTKDYPSCQTCNSPIRGPFVSALGKTWCPDHFVCSTGSCRKALIDMGFVEEQGALHCEDCYEKYLAPICGKCDKRVKGDCLNAVGKQFHPECFCCAYCGKIFGSGAFYLEDGLPYCEADWNDLFTTKCVGCGFPIEAGDRWVEALNNNYHSQCFKCSVCKSNLEGKSFYAKNGRPFCKSHAGR